MQEIYRGNGTVSAINALIWNSSNAISGDISMTNCATIEGSGDKPVKLDSWDNPVSSSVVVDGVTHTVFTIEDNPALEALVGKGTSNGAPTTDQLGKTRNTRRPTIGAIEGDLGSITISCDVELKITEGYSRDIILSADILEEYQEYTISWDISGDISGITISDGVLRAAESLDVGIYSVDIIATLTSNDESYSDDVTITITVYPYPTVTINGTISGGTAGSAFS